MTDPNDKTNKQVVNAEDNSNTIGGDIDISGTVQGSSDVHIGHTIGYTAEQVSTLITQIQTTFQPQPFDGRCPYKGLDVFEEEDAELFFGREKLVDELVSRVKESRTVFITGPSGSGKSSLVRAGLIPALKQGAIKGSDRWLYETIKPGRDPLEALASAFSRLKSPELGKYFRENFHQPDTLHECAESALSGRKDQRLVLFIDQFEEVFTQVGKEKAEAFLNMLTRAASVEDGRIVILFAMRSDFVSNCATYPGLNELLNRQFIQIGAMQPDELVSAIAQPALRVGLRIDPDLIAQIINNMQGEPGILPLMQFALKDLFDAEQARGGIIALTLADYLQKGGIHEALKRHADNAFSKLSKDEQELARAIFKGLIEIGRDTQDTRRIALFNELIPANRNVDDIKSTVQKLADARLITTDEQAGVDTVTISHEKLIDAWPWLKKLVNENRDVIALQNEIASDAKEWEEHKRDPSYLYTGARLIHAREQKEAMKLALSELAQEFVQKGMTRQQRGQMTAVGGVSAIIVLLVFAVIVFNNQANTNADLAKRNEEIANTAEANASAAQTAEALAEEQAKIAVARQLATQSQSLSLDGDTTVIRSGLLAVEAGRHYAEWAAEQALRRYLANVALPITDVIHDGPVNSVAFSPDGKFFVSGSYDRTARVWETETGKEVARTTHNSPVSSVAFSPDGKYVVSGSDDGTASVWETETGEEVARTTHNSPVSSVVFSPDGKSVVSGSDDGIARVWDAADGKEIAHILHDGSVSMVAFSPDGRYIVSGSSDGTARVWESANGKEVARMTHDGQVYSVDFNQDGRYVVSGSDDGSIRVWRAADGKEVTRMSHDGAVYSVSFSPDGRFVASGGVDGSARLWQAEDGIEIVSMVHNGPVFSVTFSPDGRHIVSGNDDGTVRIWEVATGLEITQKVHNSWVNSVAFSPDGRFVVSGSNDGTTSVWEAVSAKQVVIVNYNDGLNSVVFSPDGKSVVSGSDDGIARVWDAADGKEIAHILHDGSVSMVAFSPDGRFIVSGSSDGTARVWESANGKEVARMTHERPVSSVGFSPNGRLVISGGYDGTARVWDTKTSNEVARITHENAVYSAGFSPDGKFVVSGSHDGTARVWDAANGKEIARMTHDNYVYSVAFSPDGKYIVSGSDDGTARVWEAANGKEVARMTHDGPVNTVMFSIDGRYIISGGIDGTVRVWEMKTGKEVARITHEDSVSSVGFSPDGNYIVSGSYDNTVRVWYWKIEDLISEVCKRLPRNFTRAEWVQYIRDEPYRATCPNLPIEPEITPTP